MDRKAHKDNVIKSNNLGDTGVMDNLLEALQSGKIFGSTSNPANANRPRRTARDPRRDAGADFRRTIKHPNNINLIQAQ